MYEKILLSVILLLSCFGVFSLDIQTDYLIGGLYNYSNVFTGSTSYQKYINYDYRDIDCDYKAIFKAGGAFAGIDMFFNSAPVGLYFRAGLLNVSGVERTAADKTVKLENTEPSFNMFYDIGGVFAFNINNMFSICAAPAVSMLYVNSEYRRLYNIYSTRATIDSFLGFGATADIYAKMRYKYFVASAGCAASLYPFTFIVSADSSIDYSTSIRNTKAYNLRPYVSIGFTLKEHTAWNISPAN